MLPKNSNPRNWSLSTHMDLNVVIIISDQHRRSVMGISRHPYVRTPHLDALGKTGIQFTQAYCASPLCAPSRAAFITSTLPCNNTAAYHVYRQGDKMVPSGFHRFPGYREGLTTMGEYFSQHGYRTAAIGKMHVHGETRDHSLGFDVNGLRFYTYNFEDYEQRVAPEDPFLARRKRLQYTSRSEEGFPFDYSWTGQYNNHDPQRCPAAIETMDESVLTEADMFDVMATKDALEFIEKNKDRRFLLHLGLEKPHPPWTELERYISQYDPADIKDEDLPHAWSEGQRPFVMDWLQGNPSAEAVKMAMAGYFANVTSMDEKIGKVVQKLKDAGVYEKTLIVYLSDHGEMCYEHAQVEKHCMYEAAVNVPLIISCPAVLGQGETRDYPVSLIDILPTIGDLCGLPPVASFEGESLKPVLLDPAWRRPDKVVYGEFSQFGYRHHPGGRDRRVPMRMVRTETFKYIYTHQLPDQLYPVGSGELYPEDDYSSRQPAVLKELKRYALAGWHNDGLVSKHSDDRDIEDLLGDNHLPVSLEEPGPGRSLKWESPERISTWDPVAGKLTMVPVTQFAIYRGEEPRIEQATLVETVEKQGKPASYRLPESETAFYWVIAEDASSTLAASRTIKIQP
jgi:arylsulfatase A-like enzyme